MNIDQQFPSKWLSADDLMDRQTGRYKDTTVIIEEVIMEQVGRDKAPVVYFQGKRKGLVLNASRAKQIKAAVGTAETDDWTGHKIGLYVAPGTNGKDYINVKEQPLMRERVAGPQPVRERATGTEDAAPSRRQTPPEELEDAPF